MLKWTAALLAATTATAAFAGPDGLQAADVRIEIVKPGTPPYAARALITHTGAARLNTVQAVPTPYVCGRLVGMTKAPTHTAGNYVEIFGFTRNGLFHSNLQMELYSNIGTRSKDDPQLADVKPHTCNIEPIQEVRLQTAEAPLLRRGETHVQTDHKGIRLSMTLLAVYDEPPAGRVVNQFIEEPPVQTFALPNSQ